MRLYNCGILAIIMLGLLSCSKEDPFIPANEESARLLSLWIRSDDNREQLIEDIQGRVEGDTLVNAWIPHVCNNKKLVVEIQAKGEAYLNGAPYEKHRAYDFSRPVSLVIKSSEQSKEYMVYIHSFTGLPVMWIETEGRTEITSKEYYLPAHMILREDITESDRINSFEADLQIKGRGNSTWAQPKKPYRLKFNEKASFFGENKDKSWVLLANYLDHTMLRNATAFYIGSISNLEWTPRSHFVELMLNGRYNGTYQLTEKIKVGKNRVNVGDDGFLLEVDNKPNEGEISFTTPMLPNPVRIHEPDVQEGDDNYLYIKSYVNKFEQVLYSDDFKDVEKGFRKYIDEDSFVEWYVIGEITENSTNLANWYMNLKRDGKLKMGPIWDFDLAFCNSLWGGNAMNPYSFYLDKVSWFSRLLQDPGFKAKVKDRFNYFYNRREDVYKFINDKSVYLKYAAHENENRWHTLYINLIDVAPSSLNIWGSYYNEVQCMKGWLHTRFEWLNNEINSK